MSHFIVAASLLLTAPGFQTEEEQFNRALLAGLAVIAVFFLFLFMVQRQRHRWLALCILVLSFLAAGVIGGWKAVIAAILSSGLAIGLSAVLLRHIYDESSWAAFWHQIRMAFGRSKEIQVIDGGKTIIPKAGGTLLGPRMVVIKPYNAVMTERGARTTDVHGPKILDTEPFEFAKSIIDLRPKQQWLTVTDVLNGDLMKLTVVVCVDYSLDLREKAKEGAEPLNEQEKATLTRIAVSLSDWLPAANSAAEAAVRQAFCETRLNDFKDGGQHVALEKAIKELAQDRTAEWGIKVDKVVLQRVQVMSQAIDGGETITTLRQLVNIYQEAQAIGLSKEDLERYLERHLQEQLARNSAGQRR